jgi:hypothetical protein
MNTQHNTSPAEDLQHGDAPDTMSAYCKKAQKLAREWVVALLRAKGFALKDYPVIDKTVECKGVGRYTITLEANPQVEWQTFEPFETCTEIYPIPEGAERMPLASTKDAVAEAKAEAKKAKAEAKAEALAMAKSEYECESIKANELIAEEKDNNCAEFNKEYALVRRGQETLVIILKDGGLSNTIGARELTANKPKIKNSCTIRKNQLTQQLEALYQEVTGYTAWIEHPNRVAYDGVEFNPTGVVNAGWFNSYVGMPYQDKRLEGVTTAMFPRIDLHLREIIANNNPAVYEYFMSWLAHVVQRVGVKIGVAPVLKGQKGAGKGIICEQLMGRLLGKQHVIHATDKKHITGNFNALQERCLLMFCDEALFSGDLAVKDRMKAMITDATTVREYKRVDATSATCYMNFIMASNHDAVTGSDMADRRYWFIDVNDAWAGNGLQSPDKTPEENEAIANQFAHTKEYFDALLAEVEDDKAVQALYSYLMGRDISKWNKRDRPETAALQAELSSSLNSVGKFLVHTTQCLLDGGETTLGRKGAGEFYNQYMAYCETNKLTKFDLVSVTDFKKEIVSKANITTGRNNQGRYYDLVSVANLVALLKKAYGITIE